MAQDKSILEDAIIQMKNLEEAVAENAKGILGSVMSKEIKELVKESLFEQEDDIEDEEEEVEVDDMEDEPMGMEDDEPMDMENDDMSEPDMESPDTIDLTNAPTSQVLKVFKLMGPEDEIVVTKDSSQNISLKDNGTGKEYMIVNESDVEFDEMWEMAGVDYGIEEEEEEEGEGDFFNEEMYEEEDFDMEPSELGFKEDSEYMSGLGEGDYMDEMYDETIYEIVMDEEDFEEENFEEEDFEEENFEEEDEFVTESKKSFKAKGEGMGKADFKYGAVHGYKMKKQPEGSKMPKSSGKKVKFEFDGEHGGDFEIKPTKKKETKEGMMKSPMKPMKPVMGKKTEATEASRTYGMGSKSGRGLRKGITPNRNLTFESVDEKELEILREKNEEYRKALNVFRNKLNEVAIFNSNLAYATRLFTEHSTSKQEKINILQRFDGVETLKESKNLYKIIKDELTTSKSSQITESIERKIEKAPSTGSAVNLIESKTYENPQFLRMKDLMSKLK
jgi:hypothetical protein